MSEKLQLSFSVHNTTKKKVKYIIDYVIYFKKSNGELSPKVFKLKTGYLNQDERVNIQKQHHFKPITTRKYYSGEHQVAVKLNGQSLERKKFILKV